MAHPLPPPSEPSSPTSPPETPTMNRSAPQLGVGTFETAPLPTAHARSGGRLVLVVAIAAPLVLGALFLARARFTPVLPAASTSTITAAPSPNVIVAMRELARLETADYHVERVVEMTDEQTRLFGLVHARDAILLVAAGDIVAGVDLTKIGERDIEVDWPARRVHVLLPPPEIFSATVDSARTHVVTRTTDLLAERHEELEGLARKEAERSMRAAAEEGQIVDRARKGGERAIRDLLRAAGFDVVEIAWR